MKHFYCLGTVDCDPYSFPFTASDEDAARKKAPGLLALEHFPVDEEGFPETADGALTGCEQAGMSVEVLLLVESVTRIGFVQGV